MKKTWWKESIIYQIYPRSFKDSNGDGIGDLPGILQQLDHIKSLGANVIWLCPVYETPNDDNGYDISNYEAINPEFGTMDDFDRLLKGIHDRKMKVLMDLVSNHTSDEHSWFLESKTSRDNPKRDYYIWKDPKVDNDNDGSHQKEPNNWTSFFGGKAWEWDETTQQYYLHLFTRKQPDLNWENPNVRQEIFKQMKFWLNKGVDGFRMDVISLISKRGYDDTLYPGDFNKTVTNVYANGPRIHEFLKEMNQQVLCQYDIMTVGEGPGITLDNGLQYVHEDSCELNMVFHFDHLFIDHGPLGKFDVIPIDFVKFKKIFGDWDKQVGEKGWNSIFLGNHDFPRIVSRFANDDQYHVEAAKMLALMLFTMRGTPYIYQGDEIGMTNVAFDTIDDYRDVETLNVWKETKEKKKKKDDDSDMTNILKLIHQQGRDNARTPMQWNTKDNAGFCDSDCTPWIKVNPNFQTINVQEQEMKSDSILHFYRKMISIRQTNHVFIYGSFRPILEDHTSLFVYFRQDDDDDDEEECTYLIALNFSSEVQSFSLNEVEYTLRDLICVISNYPEEKIKAVVAEEEEEEKVQITLLPWQGIVYQVKKSE